MIQLRKRLPADALGTLSYKYNIDKNTTSFCEQENYTNWATAAGGWILVSRVADRRAPRGQRKGSTRALISGF
jgi:hypothetical protein